MKKAIILIAVLMAVAVNAQTTNFTLEWDDTTNPDSLIAGYLMYQSTTPGTGYTVVSDTLTVQSFDVSLIAGNVYYFVVTAVSVMDIESDPSNELVIDLRKPAPPTGLKVTRRF